jgi:hypothetical protein
MGKSILPRQGRGHKEFTAKGDYEWIVNEGPGGGGVYQTFAVATGR